MYQLPACLLIESTEGKNILELGIPVVHSFKAEYVSVQKNINICAIFLSKKTSCQYLKYHIFSLVGFSQVKSGIQSNKYLFAMV